MRKTGKIIKCIICNKDFYCQRVHLPTRKFCSSKCYWLDKKETSKGENNPFYGKKHSVANNEINRKAHLGKSAWNKGLKGFNKGSKHYNWKDGITKKNANIRNSIEYKLWREAVFARDNWTCQKCKIKGGVLRGHHKENFSQCIGLRTSIENGITFCRNCHSDFHKKYGIKNNTKEQTLEFIIEHTG